MQLIKHELNNTTSSRPAIGVESNKELSRGAVAMALAAATCSLLGMHVPRVEAEGTPGTWDVNAAVLFYQESGGRVQAIEPVISATRNFDAETRLNLKAVVDTLTGASPYGATPSDEVQTFTSPSGKSSYQVTPNEEPLDDSFHDTRVALSATWSAPINRDWSYTAGVYGSTEYDYRSLGLNGTLARYFNNKNTTVVGGISASFDAISPEGNIPFGLSRMPVYDSEGFQEAFAASRRVDADEKVLFDILVGVTQVINRRTIAQFNYSMSLADGYLTDPFKVLSVINDAPGPNYGGNYKNPDGNNVYLYEKRPDSRMKHALYGEAKYMRDGGDIITGSYRFMLDDWGINSHTLAFKYRWQLGNSYLEPHLRYYLQSEADFYRPYLTADDYVGGSPQVEEASADYRLGDLSTYTIGLKYGYHFDSDREVGVRLEYYKQVSDGAPGFGRLAQQDLYPDTDALWLQLNYSF